MGTIRLGLNNDSEAVYSKAYLDTEFDNEEIKPEGEKVALCDACLSIDLAIVVVKNGGVYTNAFQYFNNDILKLTMLGHPSSKLYRAANNTLNSLCEKLSKFSLVLVSGVCEPIEDNKTFLDILIDRYDVYDNIVFVDDGYFSISENTLFNAEKVPDKKQDVVIYSEVAIRDMLNLYNNDIQLARLNTAMLISVLRARRALYLDAEGKKELESRLLTRYTSILNDLQRIQETSNSTGTNGGLNELATLMVMTKFVGYNKCTQLKRLVMASKNGCSDTNYTKLSTQLYNSTYKMLSYGTSYGVKMRNYDIEGLDVKVPFAFAIYNDINDNLFVDDKHYVISFEFLGLLCGGVNKIYSENNLKHSNFEISGEIGSKEMTDRLDQVKSLRNMVDVIDLEFICQEDYLKKLTDIIVKLEKLGYYLYEFDRHRMSLVINNMVSSETALNDIMAVVSGSFIEKAISRTHVIKDSTRRHWFMGYYGKNK